MTFRFCRQIGGIKQQTQMCLWARDAYSIVCRRRLSLASVIMISATLFTGLWSGEARAGFVAPAEADLVSAVRSGFGSVISVLVEPETWSQSDLGGAGVARVPAEPIKVSDQEPVAPGQGLPFGLAFSSFVGIGSSGRTSAGAPDSSVGGAGGGSFAYYESESPLCASLWVTKLSSAVRAVLPLIPPPDVFRPPPVIV